MAAGVQLTCISISTHSMGEGQVVVEGVSRAFVLSPSPATDAWHQTAGARAAHACSSPQAQDHHWRASSASWQEGRTSKPE